MMKKSLWITSLFALAAMTSQAALADVKLRAGVANTSYSVEFDGTYNNKTSNADYKATNFGVTFIAADGLYLDLAMSGGDGTHDLWNNVFPASNYPEQEFERSDSALILGKSTVREDGSGATVYIGLKSGVTKLSAAGVNPTQTSVWWDEDKFESAGLVFGGGLSFPMSSGGTFGINGGMGLMSATWSDDSGYSEDADYAIGLSFGMSYTHPINDNFGIVLDYKGNSYNYTFAAETASEFTVPEKSGAFGINLYAKF